MFGFLKKIFPEKQIVDDDDDDWMQSKCYDGGVIRGQALDVVMIKGVKYYGKNLVATGTFLDGVLSGQGKRYDGEGHLVCEGFFCEGNLVGPGKMYSHFGNLIYEGFFMKRPGDLFSAYHGKGKEYHYKTGALLYEGEFCYNRWHGKGKEYYPNGQLRYEGEYWNSAWQGEGACYDEEGNLVFAGNFGDTNMD